MEPITIKVKKLEFEEITVQDKRFLTMEYYHDSPFNKLSPKDTINLIEIDRCPECYYGEVLQDTCPHCREKLSSEIRIPCPKICNKGIILTGKSAQVMVTHISSFPQIGIMMGYSIVSIQLLGVNNNGSSSICFPQPLI